MLLAQSTSEQCAFFHSVRVDHTICTRMGAADFGSSQQRQPVDPRRGTNCVCRHTGDQRSETTSYEIRRMGCGLDGLGMGGRQLCAYIPRAIQSEGKMGGRDRCRGCATVCRVAVRRYSANSKERILTAVLVKPGARLLSCVSDKSVHRG